MPTKKKVFMFICAGFAFQVLLVLFSYSSLFETCYNNLACQEGFLNWLNIISPYIHLFIPLFLLSLITYKMRDEVYRAWVCFAYAWVPLSMLAIFLAPEYSTDWMYPVVKGTVAFFTSLLFVIISLVLIAYKYAASRRSRQA